MIGKRYTFSTDLTVSEIVRKLDNITEGKSLIGRKKIGGRYFGSYDSSGFRFVRRGDRSLGDNIFSGEFVEHGSTTEINVSIKPSPGTLAVYFIFTALLVISLFQFSIHFNLAKFATLVVIFLIPSSFVYINIRSDIKRAKIFLTEFFRMKDSSFLKEQ